MTRSENSVEEAEEAKGQSLDDEVSILSGVNKHEMGTTGTAGKKSYAGMADQPPQQMIMPHATPGGALDKAAISRVAMIIKQEPGLAASKKGTPGQVHQK